MLGQLAALTASRGSRWAIIGLWLVLAASMAPLQGPLQEEAADESDTFQVRGSESLAAKRVIDEKFARGSEMAAVIAYVHEGGIGSEDRERIQADARAICRSGAVPTLTLVGTPYGLACGKDDPLDLSPGRALLIAPDNNLVLASALMTDDSTQTAEQAVQTIRSIVPPPTSEGLRAYVTGEAGFEADRSAAVKGIDETLLLVTCGVLVLLLLAIYRSPLVALVPIFVVGVAYVVAGGITYVLVSAGVTEVSGQTTAILIVLMFGAGTDYCLLIVARFRDELRRTEDVGEAMTRATERTGPAILSAGAIVDRGDARPGPGGLQRHARDGPDPRPRRRGDGRRRVDAAARDPRHARPAGVLARDPRSRPPSRRWPTSGAASGPGRRAAGGDGRGRDRDPVVGALGNLGGREPLPFSEAFREAPDSVLGEQQISRALHPGAGGAAERRDR